MHHRLQQIDVVDPIDVALERDELGLGLPHPGKDNMRSREPELEREREEHTADMLAAQRSWEREVASESYKIDKPLATRTLTGLL